MRTPILLLVLAAVAAQTASADHLAPGLYTVTGTVDFRIEDRPAGTVAESCEDESFVGVLVVTGPTTAGLRVHQGAGSACHTGLYHWYDLTGTPATGYAYDDEGLCGEFTEVRIGPLGPATTFTYRSAWLEEYPQGGAPALVGSESGAMCTPNDGWCVCMWWISEGVVSFE